ncbi:NACHT domain- and WD repeat-containing protein 1, partial [Durusdinium trenchii]
AARKSLRSLAGGGRGRRELDKELRALREAVFPRGSTPAPGDEAWGTGEGDGEQDAERDARPAGVAAMLLRGKFEEEDQLLAAKKVVRFFISSTFTDTQFERDGFVLLCVPHLREVCRRRGLEFQVSEMRWGINDGLSASQHTAEICLRELARCQRDSAALQFVGILGNKYGFRPFPTEIELSLFDELVARCGENKGLLERWFLLDESKLPPVMRLRPVTDHIPEYNSAVQDDFNAQWWADFERMQAALRGAAMQLAQEQGDPELELPFLQSVTEDEMRRGFASPQNLLIIREFSNLGEVHSPGFVDQDASGAEAQTRLEHLKDEMRVKASQVFEFDVKWQQGDKTTTSEGFDPVRFPESQGAYLRDVLTRWTRAVERSIAEIPRVRPDAVVDEAQTHLRFAQERATSFVGRGELVHQVTDFVNAPGDVPEQMMLVRGLSGAGKTSLLAKAALLTDANLCLRFCGTTPSSKDYVALMRSVAQQICRMYGNDDVKLADDFFLFLRQLEHEILPMASATEPLVVMLDSVDQLDGAEETSFTFDWLPAELPPHVRFVVSVITPSWTETAVLDHASFARTLEVAPLDVSELEAIVLDSVPPDRKLSKARVEVMRKILTNLEEPPTYLLLRILLSELLHLKSFSPLPPNFEKIRSVEDAVNAIFDRVELEHGALITSAALGLITSARDGLTTLELEDLLSMRDDVLKDCFRWWVQPQGRVPPLIVTRLLSSLRDFMVNGIAQTWYHRQFRRVAAQRYSAPAHFELLADYFGNRHRLAPLSLTIQKQQVKIGGDRQLQSQPFELIPGKLFNVRKLREFPRALLRADRINDMLALLFDVNFVRAMFGARLEQELLAFLRNPALPEEKARRALERALELSSGALFRDVDEIASQLLSRISDKSHPVLESVKASFTPPRQWLRPVTTMLSRADQQTRKVIHHPSVVTSLAVAKDLVLTGCSDGRVRLWIKESGQLKQVLGERGSSKIYAVAASADGKRCVAGFHDRVCRVWDVASGAEVGSFSGHRGMVFGVHMSRNGKTVVSAGSRDKSVKVWDVKSGKELKNLRGVGSDNFAAGHHNWTTSAAFSDDETQVASGSYDSTVRIWDVTSAKTLHVLSGHEHRVNAVDFHAGLVASGSADKTVRVWDASTGELVRSFDEHKASVKSVALSSDAKLVASGGDDSVVVLRSVHEGDGAFSRAFTGHFNTVTGLRFALDGNTLLSASQDRTVRVWGVEPEESGEDDDPQEEQAPVDKGGAFGRTPRFRRRAGPQKPDRHTTQVFRVALSADGKFVLSGSESLHLWDSETGNHVQSFRKHVANIKFLAIRADNKVVESESLGGARYQWDVSTGRTFNNPRSFDMEQAGTSDQGVHSPFEPDALASTPFRIEGTRLVPRDPSQHVGFSADNNIFAVATDASGSLWAVAATNNVHILHLASSR